VVVVVRDLQVAKVCGLAGVLVSLIVSPFWNYDPINLPKFLLLSCGGFLGLAYLIKYSKYFKSSKSDFLIFAFLCFTGLAIFLGDSPLPQQFWGTWGRSTGLLTYLCLFSFAALAGRIKADESRLLVRRYFERLSYAVTVYSLVQIADLDPINWSQRQMVATLGNINFVSSFLGLACISFFARIISKNLTVPSRLFYAIIASLNIFLMLHSESIQGIAVLATGIFVTGTAWINQVFGSRNAFFYGLLTLLMGVMTFLGTAGVGPLKTFLIQETVIFRLDYWRAGVSMTLNNWLTGVGFDSYGDFYRQYRDLAAAERTGPQRITNTAHNVFLDIFSGVGILAGSLFALIFILATWTSLQIWALKPYDSTDSVFAALFAGYLTFCMISINQIGVAIWGFVFLGLVNGTRLVEVNEKSKSNKIQTDQIGYSGRGLKSIKGSTATRFSWPFAKVSDFVTLTLAMVVGFALALPPVKADIDFLEAVRNKNFLAMREVVDRTSSNGFHRDRYLAGLLETNQTSVALQFAWNEIQRDPRNFYALSVIAFSSEADLDKRRLAASKLKAIDPYNRALIDELESLEKGELAP